MWASYLQPSSLQYSSFLKEGGSKSGSSHFNEKFSNKLDTTVSKNLCLGTSFVKNFNWTWCLRWWLSGRLNAGVVSAFVARVISVAAGSTFACTTPRACSRIGSLRKWRRRWRLKSSLDLIIHRILFFTCRSDISLKYGLETLSFYSVRSICSCQLPSYARLFRLSLHRVKGSREETTDPQHNDQGWSIYPSGKSESFNRVHHEK